MSSERPSFFARVPLAISTLFRILSDPEFAAGVRRLSTGASAPEHPAAAAAPRPVLKQAGPEAALQLLGLLQQEGRFVDFLQEDIAGYADADIGAATRVVHEGCRRALREYLTIEPIRTEAEGARVTLGQGFDPAAIRLTGNVVGEPPFTGSVTHRGWRATEVRLPKLALEHDVSVLAPAEVEL